MQRSFLLSSVALILVFGCQGDLQSKSKKAWYQNPVETIRSTIARSAATDGLQLFGQAGLTIPLARYMLRSCSELEMATPAKVQTIELTLSSAFGVHVLKFEAPQQTDLPVVASVDGLSFSLPSIRRVPADLSSRLCQFLEKGEANSAVEKPDHDLLISTLGGWLADLAPDCSFEFINGRGWYCSIAHADVKLASSELESIKSSMLARWSRQPYLLTRKVTLTEKLAALSVDQDTLQQLGHFCRVADFSDVKELTWTMRSKRWRKSVCDEPHAAKLEAARIGLAKSLQEIEHLRQLTEGTSKLGLLEVKIPRAELPTDDLQISLIPRADVAENIALASARLWNEAHVDNKQRLASEPVPARASGCWHPLYGESLELLHRAKILDLVGVNQEGRCTPVEMYQEEVAFSTHQYLAESITSETEFVMTNGRSKLLRLPSGTYDYIIRDHIRDLNDWDSPPVTDPARGTIAWDSRRPNVSIKQW